MSLAACAALVERSDPDRFAATMAAPPPARLRLWPLYAYNLELAKAAWVSPEPLVCQMRLQWWIDTVVEIGQGGSRKAHEVAGPLHDVVVATGLPVALLQDMAEARFRDTSGEAFGGEAALWQYLDQTAGSLMWAAAKGLGAPDAAEAAVRDFAGGAGLANWFCAVAELLARNRRPLPDPAPEAIAALARKGLARIRAARAARGIIPASARPALYAGWQAEGLLGQVAAAPERVAAGRLGLSEFRKRGGLAWIALTGRW